MAVYNQNTNKSKKPKKKQIKAKKVANPPNMNFFNNKKNSVDSVGNSISGPYLSPFFSSRDGRPSTILKHADIPTNMQIDLNSAISLLQNNNMVTVDSVKSKKVKKVIPLKDRIAQKQASRQKQSNRNTRNEATSDNNRAKEKFTKERSSLKSGNNLQSNNSFGPETYFNSELVQNKINGQYFTEGAPSINESHSKDYYQSRNSNVIHHKSYNKVYNQNSAKSPVKIKKRQGSQKAHPSYS